MPEQWQNDDLVTNSSGPLHVRPAHRQAAGVALLHGRDELGQRVGDGLGISADDVRHLVPLPAQSLSEDEPLP